MIPIFGVDYVSKTTIFNFSQTNNVECSLFPMFYRNSIVQYPSKSIPHIGTLFMLALTVFIKLIFDDVVMRILNVNCRFL